MKNGFRTLPCACYDNEGNNTKLLVTALVLILGQTAERVYAIAEISQTESLLPWSTLVLSLSTISPLALTFWIFTQQKARLAQLTAVLFAQTIGGVVMWFENSNPALSGMDASLSLLAAIALYF